MDLTILVNLIVSGIRLATPVVISSAGLCYAAQAGMSNLGTDGLMTLGAFFGVAGAYWTGSFTLGILIAMGVGILYEVCISFLAINVRAHQIIIAMGTNLLATGITSVFAAALFGDITNLSSLLPKPHNIAIPLLSDIPIVGETLFNNNILFYLAYLIIPVSWFIMNRTTIGLSVRMVGENPKAADTVGINVNRVRKLACLTRGALAALAGAYLSLAAVGTYTDNLIAGKGYISVAATIFGQWTPVGSMLGSLVFGLGESLQMRIQAIGWPIPYQALQSLPYVIALVLLTGLVRKTKQPAATGVVYIKD